MWASKWLRFTQLLQKIRFNHINFLLSPDSYWPVFFVCKNFENPAILCLSKSFGNFKVFPRNYLFDLLQFRKTITRGLKLLRQLFSYVIKKFLSGFSRTYFANWGLLQHFPSKFPPCTEKNIRRKPLFALAHKKNNFVLFGCWEEEICLKRAHDLLWNDKGSPNFELLISGWSRHFLLSFFATELDTRSVFDLLNFLLFITAKRLQI